MTHGHMPDPRMVDRLGDFEGATDPRIQGDDSDDRVPDPAADEDSRA